MADPGGGGVGSLPPGFLACQFENKFLRTGLFKDPEPPSGIPGSDPECRVFVHKDRPQ